MYLFDRNTNLDNVVEVNHHPLPCSTVGLRRVVKFCDAAFHEVSRREPRVHRWSHPSPSAIWHHKAVAWGANCNGYLGWETFRGFYVTSSKNVFSPLLIESVQIYCAQDSAWLVVWIFFGSWWTARIEGMTFRHGSLHISSHQSQHASSIVLARVSNFPTKFSYCAV